MEVKEEDEQYNIIPKVDSWFTKIISFNADIIYNCIMTVLLPFIAVSSVTSDSYHHAEVATTAVESLILKVPSKVTHGAALLLRKIGFGILAAIHVCVILVAVMLLAVILGVGLVQFWVEEPVIVRQQLFFDYTDVNPTAVFSFGGFDEWSNSKNRGTLGIPVGHSYHVSLVLLMPESDYNRQIGVFQLTAEVLSANGNVMEKSSQPCMLRFRSLPVRLIRTFIMGVPLILGISEETQRISVEMLRHKESYPRTKAIKVTLIPRAGTAYVPQLYEAEILLNSQLPWTKQVVRSWKWTFYVWASLYIYMALLLILMCCCRRLVFPMTTANFGYGNHVENERAEESKETQADGARNEKEISELLKKWQRRRKRKAPFLHRDITETECSSASSMSITREDTSVVLQEDTGDSESV